MKKFYTLNVVVIVQARMSSTRLPGKTLKEVSGKSLLSLLLERIKRAKSPHQILVATTTNPDDQKIVDLCSKEEIAVFRGSESDVLERYKETAERYQADVIVRITADCPLIDPDVIDLVIDTYLDHYPEYDYVSNTLEKTYPRGLDVEVFSKRVLDEIAKEAKAPQDRQHVTLYIYSHPEKYRLKNVARDQDTSHYRLTVDTSEDFELIRRIIEALYPKKPHFTLEDVLQLLDEHPDWPKINAHIQQK